MNARLRGMGCVIAGVTGLAAACGGSGRGTPSGQAEPGDPRVETDVRAATPGDGLELGGGQTSDFGDVVVSACDYTTEAVSRETARAEGWPVDAQLELLQPLVDVELERHAAGCAREPAGTLHIESELVGIRVARGTPRPEAAGRVECEPTLTYGVDVSLDAGDGWIGGLFHAEFFADGSELYGSAYEPAESVRGRLALLVDRARPHLARANLALWFTPSGVRGALTLDVDYSDQREPLLGAASESLSWPPSAAEACDEAQPLEAGSQWLSLDDYRADQP